MPGRRVSLYLGEDTDRLLAERMADGLEEGNLSGTIGAILGRYAEICRRSMPALESAEVNLIRDALNGCWLTEGQIPAHMQLRVEVEDAIRLNRLDSKHSVDGAALIARLALLTYAECAALIDDVERFWAAD